VPNPLILSLTIVGATLAFWHGGVSGLGTAAAGFVLGFLLMLPGHVLGATGAGDVKLLAAMGTLVGPTGIAVAFLYTAIAGGFIAVVVALRRRRLRVTFERTAELVVSRGANVGDIERSTADNSFAYAPAIAIGTLAAALGL
jgi:prepilin peptidase CpaA